MSDSVQVTPSKSESQSADSPGSSVARTEVSSAPTSPTQTKKPRESVNKVEKTGSGVELTTKEAGQGWSRAHEWFYGQVGGLFKHYGGKNWNQLLFDLERIQTQALMFDHSSVAREGLVVPLVLLSAAIKKVDPSVLCVRTSGIVLRLPMVACALKLANSFLNKNYSVFWPAAVSLSNHIKTGHHSVEVNQVGWSRAMVHLVDSLAVAFEGKMLHQAEVVYSSISQEVVFARMGIHDGVGMEDKVNKLRHSIERRGWQVDPNTKLVRIVKAPVVESHRLNRNDFSHVIDQVHYLELTTVYP